MRNGSPSTSAQSEWSRTSCAERVPLKVLAITSSYPRYEGDVTAPFIESITRGIADRGHEVHLLLPKHREWARPPSDGSIYYHPYRYSPLSSWTPWGFSESLEGGTRIRKPLYALAPIVAGAALAKARAVLAGGDFDLVHVHWVIPNGPIGARLARSHRLPLVVSLHGSDVSVSERIRPIGRLARSTFARATAVTAPSSDLLERAAGLGAHEPLERIPYGADVNAFDASVNEAAHVRDVLDIPRDAVVVTAVGRFVRWKGFDHLIDAVATAAPSQPNIVLVLVGDGDIRDELVAQTGRLGLDGRVRFAGMVGRDALPSYLAASSIVVVPSVHYDGYVDGLPNVALEAMAAGKPLIATRVGGLPDLVRPDETGLLVEEQDAGALAEAILALARDPERRMRLGVAAQAEMRERRSWASVAERFVNVYERATHR
jgi:glycosyltransferase involved in cell wall biosynthesis